MDMDTHYYSNVLIVMSTEPTTS